MVVALLHGVQMMQVHSERQATEAARRRQTVCETESHFGWKNKFPARDEVIVKASRPSAADLGNWTEERNPCGLHPVVVAPVDL